MTLNRRLLAKIDGRLRSELDHTEGVQLVKVPVSDATWSTWRRYWDVVGVPMGRGLAILLHYELASIVDEDLEDLSMRIEARESDIDSRGAIAGRRGLNAGDWVFTNQLGEPVNPEWVGKRFRKLIAGDELPTITMRQLRHSHATALLRAGVHPKVVQERLGHASIGVTLDTYSSELPTMQREAVQRLVSLIENR